MPVCYLAECDLLYVDVRVIVRSSFQLLWIFGY